MSDNLQTRDPVSGRLKARPIVHPRDLVAPELMVFRALAQAPRTVQEIELWGTFRGNTMRLRQQCVLRCLHRLKQRGWVEQTSRTRAAGVGEFQCKIWRLTTLAEQWSGV